MHLASDTKLITNNPSKVSNVSQYCSAVIFEVRTNYPPSHRLVVIQFAPNLLFLILSQVYFLFRLFGGRDGPPQEGLFCIK